MKKRRTLIVGLLVILILGCVSAVYASTLAVSVYPQITFSNNTATCCGEVDSDNPTDAITVTMALWRGTTKIDEWSDSGTGNVVLNESTSVTRYRTYRLVIDYTINGVPKPTVSIEKNYG